MPGRYSSSADYRYGFNGHEHDDEIKSDLNSYDFGLRFYDPRLGKMLGIDPRSPEYPWQTPYAYHRNSPIVTIDYLGGGDGDKETKKLAKTNPETGVSTTANDNLSTNSLNEAQANELLGFPNVDKRSIVADYMNRPSPQNGAKLPNGLASGAATPVYPEALLIPGAPAIHTSSKLLNFAVNSITNAKGASSAVKAISGVDDITESAIKDVMANAALTTKQSAVSLPMVKRYYQRLVQGDVAPAISVTNSGVIVEGNHRYIAGMMYGKLPAIKAGTESGVNAAKQINSWKDIKFDILDWGGN